MAAKKQATVFLAGMVALSLAACGTTVRHHANTLGSGNQLSGSSQTSTGTTDAGGDSAGTSTTPDGSGASDAPSGTAGSTTPGSVSSGGATTGGATTGGATTGGATTGGATTGGATSTTPGVTPTAGGVTTTTTTTTGKTANGRASAKPTETRTASAGSTSKASAAATAAAAAPTGPATGSPVQVGIVILTDLGSFAPGASSGNEKTESDAAIAYVNSHGGLNGHPIAPIYYNFQITNTQPYATTEAAICSNFTQDNHVAIGVVVGLTVQNDLANCLNQAGVAYESDGSYLHDATTYQQLPNMISPSEMDASLQMQALLSNLFATNSLTTKDKVGVLLSDADAAQRAYNNVIVPMLKAKGISVNSYPVNYPDSTADASEKTTMIDNDELHMATDGVTRVIALVDGVDTFMKQADQQKYMPKYSLTTISGPTALGQESPPVPADQLANASGIGYDPTLDVGTYGTTTYDNATTKLCRTIEGPTGQDTGALSEYATQVFCSAILTIQAAANASGAATVTGSSLINGYNALGTSYQDPLLFNTKVSSTEHAGAAAIRPFDYNTTTNLFQYDGPVVNAS